VVPENKRPNAGTSAKYMKFGCTNSAKIKDTRIISPAIVRACRIVGKFFRVTGSVIFFVFRLNIDN